MTTTPCSSCSKAKAPLNCGICHEAICKKCTQFVEEGHFSFLKRVPEYLSHTAYCPTCFIQKVEPELVKYNETMNAAQEIMVFMKVQNKETRNIKRLEEPVSVVDCADRAETILRLAFFTAQMNYNSVIDVDITSRKILTGNYQTTVFSGTGIPAHVNEAKLIKDRANWSSPN